jgi:hypothetical protein
MRLTPTGAVAASDVQEMTVTACKGPASKTNIRNDLPLRFCISKEGLFFSPFDSRESPALPFVDVDGDDEFD